MAVKMYQSTKDFILLLLKNNEYVSINIENDIFENNVLCNSVILNLSLLLLIILDM